MDKTKKFDLKKVLLDNGIIVLPADAAGNLCKYYRA